MSNKNNTCRFCGLSWPAILKEKRMGCAACYKVFASQSLGFFPSLPGSVESSSPDGQSVPNMPRSRLEEELARAVAVEDYEQAAELRDLLNQERNEEVQKSDLEIGKDSDLITGLTTAQVPWLSGIVPGDEVVLGVRLELSRNVTSCPFPIAADINRQLALRKQIRQKLDAELLGCGFFFAGDCIDNVLGRLLEERWLLDRESRPNRRKMGLWLDHRQSLALVVNHEEHLRLRAYGHGLDLINPLRLIEAAAASLARDLPFAFCPHRGYLTSDPARVGSGLQVSLLLHLPGLVFTRQLDSVIRAARELQFEIRGGFDQGNEVNGHFFHFTWGAGGRLQAMRTIVDVDAQIRQLARSELAARKRLYHRRREWLYDYVGRAYGVLRHGRLLRENEMLGFLSALRLGCCLGLFSRLRLVDLAELPVKLRNGHLTYPGDAVSKSHQGTTAWRRSDYFRGLLEKTELSAMM